MNKYFVFTICLTMLFQVGCQSVNPSPVLQHGNTPISSLIPTETAKPQSTVTLPVPSPTPSIAPKPDATLPSPSVSSKPVYVKAFCTLIGENPIIYVPQGTPVIITWGWEAKTELLVNDYIKSNLTTITLDGKTIEGIKSESVTKNAKSGQPEVAWSSNVGVLEVGNHTITYDVKFAKKIDDGSTTYGPGGKVETMHDVCQVIVR